MLTTTAWNMAAITHEPSLTTSHAMDSPPSIKRRKFGHPDRDSTPIDSLEGGWHLLQPILENEVLCAKIPSGGMGFDLLAKWFQIIAGDQEKLKVFRQWIAPSSEDLAVKIKKDIDEPEDVHAPTRPSSTSPDSSRTASPSKIVTSIDFINNDTPITPRSTPQVLLLQQLLQQQQQQIALLQKLQKGGSTGEVPLSNTITLNPSFGNAGTSLTVTIKGGQWHAYSNSCNCSCGFTVMDGTVATAHRVPGGGEGEMLFVVPPVPHADSCASTTPLVVSLTSCSAPHSPLVCATSFMYGRERPSNPANASSDDDSDTPESSLCDDDGDDEDSGDNRNPAGPQCSPKQLMTIRERMAEHVSGGGKGPHMRVVVAQQPPTRVVWKNRRLDTPFKVRVEGAGVDGPTPAKLSVLALVVDHKGKLQIDAMENFEEECGQHGVTPFHNLRMTKGTWGKEWSITFVAVRGSVTSDPLVVGVSQPCPVVVKTRKNPQVRNSSSRAESPSPTISFVERRPTSVGPSRLKRNRVEDLLDSPSANPPPSSRSVSLHSEAMNNLLYAAEIKHQEREERGRGDREFNVKPFVAPAPASQHALVAPQSSSLHALALPSIQTGFGGHEPNFANLQGLMGFLDEIKHKHHPKLSIVEQPQLKREGNVLIVKKGKPFRTPFRLQMRAAAPPIPAADNAFSPQQYICVAVLRNDKGEEVALKNSEVSFDARGLATFSGLMVMKGTWGKTVQLTFEARWGGARRLTGGNNWPPLRMLVVCETPALQLMCYTKDKKTSPGTSG